MDSSPIYASNRNQHGKTPEGRRQGAKTCTHENPTGQRNLCARRSASMYALKFGHSDENACGHKSSTCEMKLSGPFQEKNLWSHLDNNHISNKHKHGPEAEHVELGPVQVQDDANEDESRAVTGREICHKVDLARAGQQT